MSTNATTDTALGYVKRIWSSSDPQFDGGTETQDTLNAPPALALGVPLHHHKVVANLVVEMTGPEKAAVDAVRPTRAVQEHNHKAEVTKDGTSSQSVLDAAFTSKPLIAGRYELTVTAEMKMSAAATWGASGPDRTAEMVLSLDGVEVAVLHNPHDRYQLLSFVGSLDFDLADAPVFDIKIDMLGASADVLARRIRMTLKPIELPAFVEDEA